MTRKEGKTMAKRKAYPIYVKDAKNGMLSVTIPDFGNHTQGEGLADALYMARDAIGLRGICLQDDGDEVPEPYSVKYEKSEGEKEYVVDVDFAEYRAEHDTRSVRKNVTIPFYINAKAEKMGVNFSRVLQDALLEVIEA